MAVAPRPKGKATKIFYDILGKPANMDTKKTPKESKTDKRLTFEDTARVR